VQHLRQLILGFLPLVSAAAVAVSVAVIASVPAYLRPHGGDARIRVQRRPVACHLSPDVRMLLVDVPCRQASGYGSLWLASLPIAEIARCGHDASMPSRSNSDTWPSGAGGGFATIIALARSPGSEQRHLASRA
jgi:hypothetical protein